VREFARNLCTADNATMNWTFTYPSQRMPVLAENVVSTSQPLATQAGLNALRDGGSAADAAICAAAALTVVEPVANGIGSDAFAIHWNGGLQGLNASGKSPAGQSRESFRDADSMPTTGWGPVTVPGCVSAWVALHAKFGRLPFERLLEPAIGYAKNGFPVSPMTASSWRRSVEKYKHFAPWMKTFAPNGKGPATGEVVRLPDHAATLGEIATTKGESFYRGSLADRIQEAAIRDGAAMRATDLASHHPEWVEPWSIQYGELELHEMPPNGQGLAALLALGLLAHHDLARMTPDSSQCLHIQIEAMKAAFADAHKYVADPTLGIKSARQLLEPQRLAKRAAEINPSRASAWQAQDLGRSDTVYLCSADAEGRMVSYIQSNYEGFGSGIVVPGTGIALQNRGACFSIERDHANEYAPGKRPFHTIIPAFLTRANAPVAAFGVMGGAMQPQGHIQVVLRMVHQQLNPQSALDAPRWQVMSDGSVALEAGFQPGAADQLASMGHTVKVVTDGSVFFGGAQMAYCNGGSYIAASDPRRDGQAAGF
jgi:gamma-glutamyltranspeptidase/glutathione hydrolase